jgi:DNA-binding MarR family transcriptional regulator
MEMQLGRLAHAYRSAMRARFQQEHHEFSDWVLRPPSIGTLRVVARSGPISQREVSERLGAHPSDMVRVVDQLESYGLVSRVRADADRRRYDLTITPKGSTVLDRFSEIAREVDKDFYGVLSPTELKQLEQLLTKLVEHHFA